MQPAALSFRENYNRSASKLPGRAWGGAGEGWFVGVGHEILDPIQVPSAVSHSAGESGVSSSRTVAGEIPVVLTSVNCSFMPIMIVTVNIYLVF